MFKDDYTNVLPGQKPEHGIGSIWIESARGFIEKEQRGRHDEFHSDIGAFLLSAWDPTDELVANLR